MVGVTFSGTGELTQAIVNAGLGSATTVVIQGYTSIGSQAFSSKHQITSVTIPNSVTSIGELAFAGCTSLISITIPNSVTSIGGDAFYTSGITTVYIANGQVISGTTIPSPSSVPFFGRMVTTIVNTSTATATSTSTSTATATATATTTMTNSSIAQSPPIFSRISMRSLFTNNAQLYYKPHSLASGGIGSVRNCRFKSKKT